MDFSNTHNSDSLCSFYCSCLRFILGLDKLNFIWKQNHCSLDCFPINLCDYWRFGCWVSIG